MYPLLFKHGLLENHPIVFLSFIFIPSYYYWSVNTIFHGTTVKQPRLRQGHWSQHGVSIHHSTALEFDSVAWRLVCSNVLDFTSGAKEDTARSASHLASLHRTGIRIKGAVLFGYILSIVSSMFLVMWYNGIPNYPIINTSHLGIIFITNLWWFWGWRWIKISTCQGMMIHKSSYGLCNMTGFL